MEKNTKYISLVSVVFALIGTLVGGFVIKDMWAWFVSSAFNINPITYWQALGLDCLVTYLTATHSDYLYKYSEDELEDCVHKASVDIAVPLTTWGLAFIVHIFA